MNFKPEAINGFNAFEKWHCGFPLNELSTEGYPQEIKPSESRIKHLSERMDLNGVTVMELSPLEGYHALVLHNLGVKKIVSIEGRKENFLKCLVVKNAFNLERCKFLYGDLNEILSVLSGHFDLCLALGVLYHLENPIPIIYRLAELTESMFVWTHYATAKLPKGRLAEVKYEKGFCRGKYVREDIGHYLSGLQKKSFWVYEEDLLRIVKDAGFKNIDLITKEEHKNGPAMLFLAKK